MLRALLWLFWGLVIVALTMLGLANREMVTLKLLPDGISEMIGPFSPVDMPLFLVIAAAVLAGLVVGLIWEWLRNHGIRAELRQYRRAAGRQERRAPENDVLALMDGDKGR